jgi:ribosome-binding factor A
MSRQGFQRRQRLEGEIRSVLSTTLLQSVKDPRLDGVVVSSVTLNRDGTHAMVYFSVVGDAERERQAADGFKAAAPFLRRELGRRMRVRTLPSLDFERDHSFEYGDRIERLFEELHTDGVIPPADGDERKDP